MAGGGILSADSNVTLIAPYVAIGSLYAPPQPSPQSISAPTVTLKSATGTVQTVVSPSSGTGNLTIVASDLIDIGSLVLQTIGSASLTATNDIRGDGTFEIQGALTLTAGQVYPITDTLFTIAAFDQGNHAGSVTFNSTSVARPLPYSAGGTLNVFATNITQDGVLRAPLGSINLGSTTPQSAFGGPTGTATAAQTFDPTNSLTLGSGSVTSVSAVNSVSGQALTLPFGTELNGSNWIDPSGTDITSGGVPAKAINLGSATVDIKTGATLDLTGGGDPLRL